MSKGTIFFSYSRKDEAFVLDLAKRLRSIGANIWIDQLDIEAGRNWDNAVEGALEASDSVLVVLSKSSVASRNVMDEVSIALEEGKKVIPVLYEDCKRPFRLKRLHYADFTKDHERGFQSLLASLRLEQAAENKHGTGVESEQLEPVPEKSPSEIVQAKTEEVKELSKKENSIKKEEPGTPVIPKPKAQQEKPVKPAKKSNSGVLWAVVVVLLLATAGFLYYTLVLSENGATETTSDGGHVSVSELETNTTADDGTSSQVEIIDPDQADFQAIENQNDFAVFSQHLNAHENCAHASQIDSKFWAMAMDADQAYTMSDYAENFPQGAHAEEAAIRLAAMEKERMEVRKDSLAWAEAVQNNSVQAFLTYVMNDSIRRSYADAALKKADSVGKRGYLFIGRSLNESEMSSRDRIVQVIWSPNGNRPNKKPEQNDIVTTVQGSRYTYRDPGREAKTGHTFKADTYGMVLEVQEQGSALVAKVLYD